MNISQASTHSFDIETALAAAMGINLLLVNRKSQALQGQVARSVHAKQGGQGANE